MLSSWSWAKSQCVTKIRLCSGKAIKKLSAFWIPRGRFYFYSMAENFQLKELFNEELISKLGRDIHDTWAEFDYETFTKEALAKLGPLSLTERAQTVMECMAERLPRDYSKAIRILLQSMGPESDDPEVWGYDVFYYMPHCNFVAKYGIDHFDESMHAMYEITKRFTAEFPIRSFIIKYPDKTFAMLKDWLKDENVHVRRLVSEGTRPRLPWASRLPEFQKDPAPVLELLEELNRDPELYVRRSVANNLNDIAKDHPDLVVGVLKRWQKLNNPGTDWIIKHASRSLLKDGNTDALLLLGYNPMVRVDVANFDVQSEVQRGDQLSLSFQLTNMEDKAVDLMIDYRVHFLKANGKQSPKVFKLAKKRLKPGESIRIEKNHSFKIIGTRKYYPGDHAIELQINGKAKGRQAFLLK